MVTFAGTLAAVLLFGADPGALGFAEAKPGGNFVKIGVGVLRKPQAGESPVPPPPSGRGDSDPTYVKTLEKEDQATATAHGFGESAKDYDIRVENKKLGAGYRVEPCISMSIQPGKEFTWNLNYEY